MDNNIREANRHTDEALEVPEGRFTTLARALRRHDSASLYRLYKSISRGFSRRSEGEVVGWMLGLRPWARCGLFRL